MPNPSYETPNGILAAARELGLDRDALHQLPGSRAQAVLDTTLDTFTNHGRNNRMRYWLWEDLRSPTLSRVAPPEPSLLLKLGPPSTPVWLIVEDWDSAKRGSPFWVFEASLGSAFATLQNHHLLEFYFVSRTFTWLVCRNHHDALYAVGEHAISTLKTFIPE